jgi:hypothetical protein
METQKVEELAVVGASPLRAIFSASYSRSGQRRSWQRTCSLLLRGTRDQLVMRNGQEFRSLASILALSQASETRELRPLPI